MPRYTVILSDAGPIEVNLTYEQYDTYKKNGTQFIIPGDGIPITHFTGPGFTRRSTDSRDNTNIDHHDWRGNQHWPGNPEKKAGRPKRSGWTSDDFRKKGI